MTNLSSSSLWRRPGTKLGWWAVGLGAVGLIAAIRKRERSWLVWLTTLYR